MTSGLNILHVENNIRLMWYRILKHLTDFYNKIQNNWLCNSFSRSLDFRGRCCFILKHQQKLFPCNMRLWRWENYNAWNISATYVSFFISMGWAGKWRIHSRLSCTVLGSTEEKVLANASEEFGIELILFVFKTKYDDVFI